MKKDEQLFTAFVKNEVDETLFTDETIEIPAAPDFPIYMGKGSEIQKKADFLEAFKVISEHYVNIDRDIHMNERFWHSLLV